MQWLWQGKRLRRGAGYVLLAGLFWFMLRWFEHHQVYQPYRSFDADAADLGRPFEDVVFRAADGVELHGWYFPLEPGSDAERPVVLLCHGNAGNISHRLGSVAALLEAGAGVFVFDYRGYGRSAGRPSEEGTYRDAQAAHAWLRSRGHRRIVVMGESLGGGVASELALRETVSGLVLQSTFTSITDLGAELFPWLPVRWLGRIRYDTRSKLPQIQVPVLILHGRGDELVGYHHAERNHAAANEPRRLRELGGGHNNFLEIERSRFVEAIRDFVKEIAQ